VPEITVTVTPIADIAAGARVTAAIWSAGFDHAALVAAGRSRADAKDFRMRNVATGDVQLSAVNGANTATCTVEFILVGAITAPTADGNYRLGFGDLGWTVTRVVASGVSDISIGDATVAASVPALTLPAPSFGLPTAKEYDRAVIPYPESLVVRERLLSESPRNRYDLVWRDANPEDWYTIRAWAAATKGGAGTGSTAFGIGTVKMVPGTLALTQDTKGRYQAAMSVRTVNA
jgi:hypothetical protein